jgi:hypothetical protein
MRPVVVEGRRRSRSSYHDQPTLLATARLAAAGPGTAYLRDADALVELDHRGTGTAAHHSVCEKPLV